MKDQSLPSPQELQTYYSKQKESSQSVYEQIGVTAAIESLSRALKDLADIGIDVRLQLCATFSEDSAALIRTVNEEVSQITIAMAGILKVDTEEYLLAITAKENEDNVLKIYVSELDYKGQGNKQNIRGKCFDLNADSKSIQKLQQFIIFTAARNEIIREHDVCDVFDKDGHPVKLVGKPFGSKPPRL